MTESCTRTLNYSVAVTGHVDAGKTSLVRALSTVLSTAALDKAPQSQARGITLDLGFSAFTVAAPPAVAALGFSALQFTLVDCPGHASLIRTVIGGAQIMDAMILVVDVAKGFQTQTAECLVVGEITTNVLIVALNKIDMLPLEGRAAAIARAITKVKKILSSTKFADAPIVPITAAPRADSDAPSDVGALISTLVDFARPPVRDDSGPFLFAVDHCFAVRGHGTVLTGTVLAGSISVGDTVEIPSLRAQYKCKTLQMFKKPAQRAAQGDRAGLCVTGLDPSQLERGLACAPASVPALSAVIALVKRVRFFKGTLPSEGRVHVTIGHTTVMATAVFFGARELAKVRLAASGAAVSAAAAADADVAAAEELYDENSSSRETGLSSTAVGSKMPVGGDIAAAAAASAGMRSTARGIPVVSFQLPSAAWEWQGELMGGRIGEGASADATDDGLVTEWQWAALLFDSPVLSPVGSLIVGARLDADIHANACRIAFYGRLACPLPPPARPSDHALKALRFFKWKIKTGSIDRIEIDKDGNADGAVLLIGKSLFKKDTDMNLFSGLTIYTAAGQSGVIEGAFGKSGKFKATFSKPSQLDARTAALVTGKAPAADMETLSRSHQMSAAPPAPPIRGGDSLYLRYKKALFCGSRAPGEAAHLEQ